MLKKELVEKLMEMTGGEYTKSKLNKMLKADLEKLYEEYSRKSVSAEKCTKTDEEDKHDTMTAEERKAVEKVKAFDFERYANFVCHKKIRDRKPSTHQYNLIKALENNYKVKFDNIDKATFGELSDRISACYEAIKQGRVKKRSDEEILARLKNYKPKRDNSPTKAQLHKINELEKRTGVTCKRVISNKQVASEVIKNYLEILDKAKELEAEVAVTTANDTINNSDMLNNLKNKLKDKSFRVKFIEYLKRMF